MACWGFKNGDTCKTHVDIHIRVNEHIRTHTDAYAYNPALTSEFQPNSINPFLSPPLFLWVRQFAIKSCKVAINTFHGHGMVMCRERIVI